MIYTSTISTGSYGRPQSAFQMHFSGARHKGAPKCTLRVQLRAHKKLGLLINGKKITVQWVSCTIIWGPSVLNREKRLQLQGMYCL